MLFSYYSNYAGFLVVVVVLNGLVHDIQIPVVDVL
jgi:hypothetical protein